MTADEIAEGIAPATLAQLQAIPVEAGRPLIAVDVDEVLVVFVDHLDRYIRTLGYRMRLESYQLEGSIYPVGSDEPLPFDACIALIDRFFGAETAAQQPVPGGAAALRSLARDAQIVILTNVPAHATVARRRNLDGLGIRWPLVVNSGGKGRAIAWLAAQTGAPCAFVDDSVVQIESVAKHAPDTIRIHFAWADFIDRLFPSCDHATGRARDWSGAEAVLRAQLALNGAASP